MVALIVKEVVEVLRSVADWMTAVVQEEQEVAEVV